MPSIPDPNAREATPDPNHSPPFAGNKQNWVNEIRAMVAIINGQEPLPVAGPVQVRTIWFLCVLIAGVLTLNYYCSRLYGPWIVQGILVRSGAFQEGHPIIDLGAGDGHLIDMVWWGGSTAFGYLIWPIIWLIVRGEKILPGMGWTAKGLRHHWPIYLIMALVMVPALFWATNQEGFLRHYPFYKIPSYVPLWPRFFIWEITYVFQFFALESFFRGFVIGQLGKVIGGLAVPVAMVPYCMIHFGKPLPETIASIIAGLGLGTLSYKSGCIWPGAVLHIAVAITMDMASLSYQGRFR